MPSFTTPKALASGRIEREVERERQEHAINQEAKNYLGDDDQRMKDARETVFSSTVKRFK
ncbi:hypothetical protein [Massilia sp. PWRC2]|uniref:hypothetical protein n=1 Tax=Massilia sp. PWRC2 TaxID=2804626 RepID=UPI003CE9C179